MSSQSYSDIPEGFKIACSINELSERKGKRVFINDVDVALFKVEGNVYALSNVCPHQHASVVYDGFLEDDYVLCPSHGWKFNLLTGKQPTGYKGLDPYEVVVIGNDVYVKADKKELKW
jgi:nitrite reductase/ring-hydroxylating ferredoxin subunit